ncbi:hypothetical protein K2X33_01320 [bacterium]|nr:hypothetical protein [bacterium]
MRFSTVALLVVGLGLSSFARAAEPAPELKMGPELTQLLKDAGLVVEPKADRSSFLRNWLGYEFQGRVADVGVPEKKGLVSIVGRESIDSVMDQVQALLLAD